jgi:3-dehydroquinate synthase
MRTNPGKRKARGPAKPLEKLRVELAERSYEIAIGSGTLGGLGENLRGLQLSPRLAIISNPTVHGLYGGPVESSLRASGFQPATIIVPDGERYKSLLWVEYIYGEMLRQRLDRKSAVVALGGGVVGDMAGFVASTYMRGIAYVQVPTTLLAQVDSSVGGKTGVNHPLGKNMIGTFWQPALVWIDADTLKSLPRREFLAGLSEVIKYGVIWDRDFFDYLEKHREDIMKLRGEALIGIIKRSCEIKAEVVSRDEREAGLRAILNYGHTIGHAVETATGYTRYLHGEALAMGMHTEAELARTLGITDREEVALIKALIDSYGLPSGLPGDVDKEALVGAMELDKKALAGTLRFTLPEKVGKVKVNEPVDREKLRAVLRGKS